MPLEDHYHPGEIIPVDSWPPKSQHVIVNAPSNTNASGMTAARLMSFQNACSIALQKVIVEFKPKPIEMQLVLESLHIQLDTFICMSKGPVTNG